MPANTSPYTVYFLKEGDTLAIRYVGITSKTLERRLTEHLTVSRKANPHKQNWLDKMQLENREVIIESVETNLSHELACEIEMYYISLLREQGLKLTNKTNGGEAVMAGRKHSDDTKIRMSKERTKGQNSFYGKKHTEASRAQMSKNLAGRKSWNKGKRLTEEHRLNLCKPKSHVPIRKSRFDFEQIKELKLSGLKNKEIAAIVGTDGGTISKYLKYKIKFTDN